MYDFSLIVKAAKAGEVWGVMVFGPNFTQALVEAAIEGNSAGEELRNMSKVKVQYEIRD